MQNRLVRLCFKNSSVKVDGPGRLKNLFGPVSIQSSAPCFAKSKEGNITGVMRFEESRE
jgi:hypothetical protein